MADTDVFDVLTRGLDKTERRRMLRDIEASLGDPMEPLRVQDDAESEEIFSVEIELSHLRLVERILLYVKSLLLGREIRTLVKDTAVKRLRDRINGRGVGVINFRTGKATDKMRQVLASLQSGVGYFAKAIETAFSNKSAFYPFLVGLELELIQSKLTAEIGRLENREDFDDDVAFQRDLEGACGDIMDGIPESDRSRVYRDVQALWSLQNLGAFGFKHLDDRLFGEERAAVSSVGERLQELAERLGALNVPPSTVALQALFLFAWRHKLAGAWGDFHVEISDTLVMSRRALDRIREFARRTPMIALTRYATGNLNWLPRKMGGGEEWFLIYREFWMDRVAAACRAFYLKRKRGELVARVKETLGLARLPQIKGVDDLPLVHFLSLCFLKGLTGTLLETTHRPLKIIYLNGQFYKEQNQQEFADSFDGITQLGDKIGRLERQFRSDGSYGGRILDAKVDPAGVSARRRRLAEIAGEVDRDIQTLVDSAVAHTHGVVRVLGGILDGQPGERYDSLSNLETIGGSENKPLVDAWRMANDRLALAWRLLCEIKDVELAVGRPT